MLFGNITSTASIIIITEHNIYNKIINPALHQLL